MEAKPRQGRKARSFTPAHWWHEVRSVTPSITFNFQNYGRPVTNAYKLRKYFYYRARRRVLDGLGLKNMLRLFEE